MENKKSFREIYKEFWARAFDFKGQSSLREYWLPVGFHIGLLIFALAYYLIVQPKGGSALPFWIVMVYLLIALVPFIALTIRRLRDTGLSGLWALLLLFVGAGTFVVLALCAAGSGFVPFPEQAVCLYGPPPIESTSFDPRNNTVPALYGPPLTEAPEESATEVGQTDTEPESSSETAGTPETEPVGTDAESSSETGGLSPEQDGTDFLPSENVPEPLYGPPPTVNR